MNILILDYLPQVFSVLATLYFALQMVRWAERGKYRWIVYGLLACLGVWSFFVAQVQVEALQLHDLQQSQTLSADCMTDWECEQLELAQSETEE